MADNKIDGVREPQTEPLRPKEKEKTKEEKSDFDRMLEQNQQKQALSSTQKLTIRELGEYAAREGNKQDERKQEKEREKTKDRDREGDHKQSDRKRDTGITEQRVIAKGSSQQQRDGGGSGRGSGQGFQGEMRKRQGELSQKLASGKEGPISLANRFEQQLKNSLQQASQSEKITQSILKQIVQTVRFGLNQAGDKEIHIRFQEQVFRGLKLRVTQKDGKIEVQFVANDRKTREIFKKEKSKILAALREKGISVAEISVV